MRFNYKVAEVLICDEKKCVGCQACYVTCTVDAITMSPDIEGFLRPSIDEKKCINCGKCKKVCPVNKKVIDRNEEKILAYAYFTENEQLREKSTSGGAFSEIASQIIADHGIVFGAKFNNEFCVVHSATSKLSELEHFRGSKYVQSSIGKTYEQVSDYLKLGKKVFFTGTPCQIAGLYGYLGVDNDNLFTCDLICHGVPSPMVFKDYLNYIKGKHKADIVDIKFRYKKPNWTDYSMKIEFNNNKIYNLDKNHDPYLVGFLRDCFLRPSCYECSFANTNRQGDITLGDFWGYKDSHDNKGISLVIVNSKKGQALINSISNSKLIERDLFEAVAGNPCLSYSFPSPTNRKEFWKDYGNLSFVKLSKKYFSPLKPTIKSRIVKLLPNKVRKLAKNIKNKVKKI